MYECASALRLMLCLSVFDFDSSAHRVLRFLRLVFGGVSDHRRKIRC